MGLLPHWACLPVGDGDPLQRLHSEDWQAHATTLQFIRCKISSSLIHSASMCRHRPRSSYHTPANEINLIDHPMVCISLYHGQCVCVPVLYFISYLQDTILDCFNPLDIYPGGYILYMGDTLNCDAGVRVNTVSP